MCIIIKSCCFAEVFQHVCIIFYATFRYIFFHLQHQSFCPLRFHQGSISISFSSFFTSMFFMIQLIQLNHKSRELSREKFNYQLNWMFPGKNRLTHWKLKIFSLFVVATSFSLIFHIVMIIMTFQKVNGKNILLVSTIFVIHWKIILLSSKGGNIR